MKKYHDRVETEIGEDGLGVIVKIDGEELDPAHTKDGLRGLPENQQRVMAGIAQELFDMVKAAVKK